MKSFRDKLIEKKNSLKELTISLPARKVHQIVPCDDGSPRCISCSTCCCFENDIYDLYHVDKTAKIESEDWFSGRPVATCKTCHHDNYYSPLDYHSPAHCHCLYSEYPDKCRECDKEIITAQVQEETTSAVPCTSFAWDWTAAVDRDSSFHYDFGFDLDSKCFFRTCLLLATNIPDVLFGVIQGYLCLDIEQIKQKIIKRGNKLDFQATTNGDGLWVISIYERSVNVTSPWHIYEESRRTSSWRYSNLFDAESVEKATRDLLLLSLEPIRYRPPPNTLRFKDF